MKALIISHGHPDFSVGGAEIAAYNLYRTFLDNPAITEATFLARSDLKSLSPGVISLRRTGEYLWRQDIFDWFRLRSAYPRAMHTVFREFLQEKKPDIVFVHHYANIGIEVLRELRRCLPDAFIALTLHEYVAICHSQGQMVKAKNKRLCQRESEEECSGCFPEFSPNDFFLRKHFIQRHFEVVNMFISPSEFLRERYIAWGIPENLIVVIENGQPSFDRAADPARDPKAPVRFGFFGQVTPYKGVDVLLQSLHFIRPELRKQMLLEVHGANLELQNEQLQETISQLRAPLVKEGSLRWVGPYEPHELRRRMSKIDWVVIPSIWWENSPMVIQEAFANGKPVVCSNIGGMAEKVRDQHTGLHFEARNPFDLAEVLSRAIENRDLHSRLVRNIQQPLTYKECGERYLALVG
ncbi:MAG: glycosyltransferase family 4 protein [Proteobacteria bacterium]|nr:glycosyltransferase family 4 protein [Pseudomonadota bacterium]